MALPRSQRTGYPGASCVPCVDVFLDTFQRIPIAGSPRRTNVAFVRACANSGQPDGRIAGRAGDRRWLGGGVQATTRPSTWRAPAARSARAAADKVAPVVQTSSSTTTRPGTIAVRGAKCTCCRRARPSVPVCAAPGLRCNSGVHPAKPGRPARRRATARASIRDWSKPRLRARPGVVGAQVNTPESSCSCQASASSSASQRMHARLLRYLRAPSSVGIAAA